MTSTRNSVILVIALLILGAVLFKIARSASDDSTLNDEWFDFEHPQ